eukprot:CAMPEP_0113603270 /NCGR_PEP_ID=MMETSP0017_2-20120614/1190_1 /TAXON_ID=2856 /ORGANISM="Cylindrotheca closterium" /LENGTH=195 /DNA_ID=CAMNT_0000511653 /DNA_START=76 /DNA_END=663 /DNA_ORIENTATION=+ /assembly_acc=CAM_ASM_000147
MSNASKKKVTFNPSVRAATVLSITDYTDSEIDASWYNDDEMDRITQRAIKILMKMESAKQNEAKRYCFRGLEGHSKLGSISKKKNRSEAREAVFGEQDRRWNESDEFNDQAVADAYRQTTSSSQMWAQVMGRRDRKAVESYLFQEEVEDEVMSVGTQTTERSLKSTDSNTQSPGSEMRTEATSRVGHFQPSARAA